MCGGYGFDWPGSVELCSPLLHVVIRDGLRGYPPGAVDPPPWQPFEIKLAADLGVWATGVGDVVAVEGHHVTEDVCAGVGVWSNRQGETGPLSAERQGNTGCLCWSWGLGAQTGRQISAYRQGEAECRSADSGIFSGAIPMLGRES